MYFCMQSETGSSWLHKSLKASLLPSVKILRAYTYVEHKTVRHYQLRHMRQPYEPDIPLPRIVAWTIKLIMLSVHGITGDLKGFQSYNTSSYKPVKSLHSKLSAILSFAPELSKAYRRRHNSYICWGGLDFQG